MKKNLISVVILALLVVNIVFSAITLFSVAGTNKKTAALVTDIASAIKLDLDLADPNAGEPVVPMADVATYDIAELTIPLKAMEGDDKDRFGLVSVTLSMNMKDKDYSTYGEDLDSRRSLIISEINNMISQRTMDEAKESNHIFEDEILEKIQTMFDSKFIYKVTITSAIYQ